MTCYFGGNHPAVLDEWIYVNLCNNNEHPCMYHRERIIKGYLNSWRYVEIPCIETCICYCSTVCIKITNPKIPLIPTHTTENNTESLNKRSDVLCMFYIISTTYLYDYIWYWYGYIYIYMYNCTRIESYVIWHPLMGIASQKSGKLIDFNQRRIRISKWMQKMKLPTGSMYGIFTYIYHKTEPNVPHAGQYIIHGSYGNTKYGAMIEPVGLPFVDKSCLGWTALNPSKQ